MGERWEMRRRTKETKCDRSEEEKVGDARYRIKMTQTKIPRNDE